MPVINVMIRRRKASNPVAEIVCGNSDYHISFNFDSEWDAYDIKTARFIWNGQKADVVFTGNVCDVPVIKNATICAVGVFAGDLRTTTPALIACNKSILCSEGAPADPMPEVYAQIMELLNSYGRPTDEQATAAVNAWLEAHPEATTTVEDGSITYEKLHPSTISQLSEDIGGGLNDTAKTLLITIMRNGVYSVDQSANITALEAALASSGNSGDDSGGSGDTGDDSGDDTPETVTYTITNNLTDVVSNNTDTSVNKNAAYSATLTAADGFTLEGASVSVKMGDVDITTTAYANGVVSISAVTGNVVITAKAVMQGLSEYTITNTLNGVTNSNAETTISEGGTYTATLAADDTHVLPDVDMGGTIVITMGGTDITNSVYNYGTGAVSISPVTGNIVITVAAADKPVIIEEGLQDFFDYRNKGEQIGTSGNYNVLSSDIGDGWEFGVPANGADNYREDGCILSTNTSYSPNSKIEWTNYDGTDHEWTIITCINLTGSGYIAPFAENLAPRIGMNFYPKGNYYNTSGTEVEITSPNTTIQSTAGIKIAVVRTSKTEKGYLLSVPGSMEINQIEVFNASDYADFGYFSPAHYTLRAVNRSVDPMIFKAIYKRALTDEEIAEVVRYMKMEVA